jgi:hypothetical protein
MLSYRKLQMFFATSMPLLYPKINHDNSQPKRFFPPQRYFLTSRPSQLIIIFKEQMPLNEWRYANKENNFHMKPVHIRLPNSCTASALRDMLFRGIGVAGCFFVLMIIIASAHAQSAREIQSQKSLIAQRVATLKQVRDVFREIAASPLPHGRSAAELAEARRYVEWLKTWAARLDGLAAKGESTSGGASGGSGGQDQKMSASFNLQYLGLQQQMQDENRRFTMISNIMKIKHDTARNAINNVR